MVWYEWYDTTVSVCRARGGGVSQSSVKTSSRLQDAISVKNPNPNPLKKIAPIFTAFNRTTARNSSKRLHPKPTRDEQEIVR